MVKKRKILSLLCAASMAVSAFAGLTLNVGAATQEDVLWSDTFNGQNTGIIVDGTTKDSATESEWVKGLTFVTTNRGNGDAGSYTDSAGNRVMGGSYYAVEEKEDKTDKYLRLSFPVFGDFAKNGRWAHVDLGENGYAATAEKDVVMDFDVKLTDGIDKGVKSDKGNPVLRIGSFDVSAKTATAVEINKETLGISDDWIHARIIVSNSAGAKLYIGGEEAASAANANVKALNTIGLYSSDPEGNGGAAMADIAGNAQYDDGSYSDAANPTKTAIADIDNVIIYNEAAGVATGTSKAPGAQDQQGGDATPTPTKDTTIPAAPVLTAPASAEEDSIKAFNFDSDKVIKWSLGTADQDITDIDGLNIHIGSRSNGGAASTFTAVAKNANGNVLQFQAAEYAHAGRGPRMTVADSMNEAFVSGKTLAMSFAVRLSAPEGHENDAAPRLYLMKDASQAGSDGLGAYNKIAAVLTAVEGEEIMRGENDVISAYITPDEWHYVTFVVTPNGTDAATHRLYIDGAEEPAVKCDYVATGEAATFMSDLPMLSPQSKAAKINGENVGPDFGVVTIDNMLVYYGEPSEPKRMCATASEPEIPDTDPEITATIDATGTKVTSDIESNKAIVAKLTKNADNTYKLETKIGLAAGENTIAWTTPPKAGDKIIVLRGAASMAPAGENNTATIQAAE